MAVGVDADLVVPGDREFRFRVGLRPVDAANWLEPDERRNAELLAKQELLSQRHDEVVATLPGSESASLEVLELVIDELTRRELVTHSGAVARDLGTGIEVRCDELHPIDAAGRLIQEDLCVMAPGPQGHELVAASLCFPGRWRLADKIGRSMAEIHASVPRYGTDVSDAADRVLARLAPGRIVERFNWSVMDDATLFQPSGHGRSDEPPATIGSEVVLRTERQTLRGLTDGSVLFGIRTRVRTLDELAGRPEFCGELADSLRRLPDDVVGYKSLSRLRPVVIVWLEAAAGR